MVDGSTDVKKVVTAMMPNCITSRYSIALITAGIFTKKKMFYRDYKKVLYLCVARDMKYHELDSRENLQAKTSADMLIEYRYK